MKLIRSAVSAAVLLAAAPVMAQTAPVERKAQGVAGKEIRVGVFGNIKLDCTTGPAPQVRVTSAPSHGSVIVRRGKVRTKRVQNCPTIQAPVLIAFYRSRPEFSGMDRFTLEIKTEESVSSRVITVTVRNPKGPIDL